MDSHTDRTIRGVNYNFLNTAGKTILHFIVGIVLARLILPADFGLLGMAYIFIGLANLFSTLGMGSAIVQKSNLNNEHIRIAATLSLLLSLIIYIAFWFFSPLISEFFNEPKVTPIVRVISTLFIFQGLYSISRGLIVRKMDFKSIFIIETIAFAIGQGAISIILAFLDYGVWSLVFGRVITGILLFILFIFKASLPIKPLLKKNEAYELFSFGSGVSLVGILNYAATNVDYLAIGKFLTPLSLGLYTRAYNLMSLPLSQISATISGVLFSAYSEIQDQTEKLRRSYLKAINLIGLTAFPVLAGMIACSYYIIVGLYGKNWEGAIEVFILLSISAFFKVIYQITGAITKATGNVYREVWRQFVYLIILASGVLIGVRFGIEGVGFVVIFASVWLYISLARLVTKIIDSPIKAFFQAQVPGLVVAVIVFLADQATIFLLNTVSPSLNDTIKLIILVIVSLTAILLCYIFLPESIIGEMPKWIYNKYKKYIPFKFAKKQTKLAV